jgi:hypothetical protein
MLVTYGRAPRQMHYRLDARRIHVNGQAIRLTDYRAFTIETARSASADMRPCVALLLPTKRFRLALPIALPENAEVVATVRDALERVLTFDDAEDYLAHLRLLDRIAGWLRLL